MADMRRTVGVRARGALVHALAFVAATLAVVSCARTSRDEAAELSRLGNWIRIRVEGGVVTSVAPGDFDRYELLASAEEGSSPAPFGRASVCKLFENIFVPGESNDAGPIRVAGMHPRVFVGYHLVQTDGRTVEAPEVEIPLSDPLPEAAPPARKPSRR
jgi:hypothetical protein